MNALMICYHPDFGSGRGFRRRSRLSEVAIEMSLLNGHDVLPLFPDGSWLWWVARGWRDIDTEYGGESEDLRAFDRVSAGRMVLLLGYSDGASMANYIATYRSEQVIAVVSYAGRLQRAPWSIDTPHKFPVLDV